MNNKRAFLLAEETVKIIIAVIAIAFLIYFLTSLYLTNKQEKNLKFAEASLKHLIEEMNNKIPEVEIYNPNNWAIFSWPNKGIKNNNGNIFFGRIHIWGSEGPLPTRCSSMGWERCLCFCPVNRINLKNLNIKYFSEFCGENGACSELKEDFNIANGAINIEPPIKLNIDYKDGIISKA